MTGAERAAIGGRPVPEVAKSEVVMSASSATPSTATLADFTGHVVLVGAGQMGGALLRGWLSHGLAP